ncbi:MAG TPA: tetratricopeptide repeat protein [Candidatus Obscuribacterales bacterium]
MVFQGNFGIPEDLKEMVRRSSDAEVTEFVLESLKEVLRNPQQLAQMAPTVPPQLLAGLRAFPATDAALRPLAQSIAEMLIQEVRFGKKATEEGLRSALLQSVMSPNSLDWISQIMPDMEEISENGDVGDMPPEVKKLLDTAEGADSLEDAEAALREAFEISQKSEPESVWALTIMQHYASCLLAEEKYSEAEPILKNWLKLGEQLLSPEHGILAGAYCGLAEVRASQNKNGDADLLFGRAIAIADKSSHDPSEHAEILKTAASYYESQNLSRKSDPLFDRAFNLMGKAHGPDHLDTAEFAAERAMSLLELDRLDEAEKWCRRALAIKEATLARDHFDLLRTKILLSDILLSSRQHDKAEIILTEAVDRLSRSDSALLRYPLELLKEVYEQTGRAEQAAQIEARLSELPEDDGDLPQ